MSISTLPEFLASQPRPNFSPKQSKDPCVYYICSLDNYRKILKSGYILPKNRIDYSDTSGDLSSSTIQARRENSVNVGDGKECHPKPGHDCLNFFLNPHNSTFQAFVRNSMVACSGENQVLILEISLLVLADYLTDRNNLFGCSAKNIAKGGVVTSIKDEYSKFSWNDIMATKGVTAVRAAEFLLWISDDTNVSPGAPSMGLPADLINKVYANIDLLVAMQEKDECDKSFYNHTWSTRFLFSYARELNDYMQNNNCPCCSEVFDALERLEAKMPFPLSAYAFTDVNLALHYQHGYPHVLKVMFWIALLTHPTIINKIMPRDEQCQYLAEDCMFAALIHDLARTSNYEDEEHGKIAVSNYTDELLRHTGRDLTRVKRIRQAVADHCKSDFVAKDKNNPVWKILKDADALDRGRFADPCDSVDLSKTGCKIPGCRHSGCVHRTLRLNYDQLGGTRKIADAARNLAMSISTAPLSPTEPVKSFIRYVGRSVEIAS